MTTTTQSTTAPRVSQLDRSLAMSLAATEYQRFADLLASLRPDDWDAATCCAPWDVRMLAAHLLGMAKMAASLREQRRQTRAAKARGGTFIDALTGLQVAEHMDLTPAQLVTAYRAVAPKAARARRRTPGFIRRRPMPEVQDVGGTAEVWTIGYLVDVILTRDPWLHRIDIVDATGAQHVLTAEHDGVIVDDVVREWAQRHGQPYSLHLTGPAGGTWSSGSGGAEYRMGVAEFCRALSGRAPADGLLATQVPF